jgi:DNA modification methylase
VANALYFGDNLEVLRESIKDESVDLIYLDPPFNSNATYNVLFKTPKGHQSDAQIEAFDDTWHWGVHAEAAFADVIQGPNTDVAEVVRALRTVLGENDMMAYLTMMAVRLLELHRVLKPTGSLYLHCDPTASHYLKIVLDQVFGVENFRNEIIWRRTNAHNKLSRQFGPIHDTILFYSRGDEFTFHPGRRPYTKHYVAESFPGHDKRGYFQSNVLTGSGTRAGNSGKPWKMYDPTTKGRHWAISNKLIDDLEIGTEGLTPQQILDLLDAKGLILHPASEESIPRYKQYLDTSEGVLYQDIWAYQPGSVGLLYESAEGVDEDVKWLDSGEEKIGYPTQKPLGLLQRIIYSSSNEDDVVLDPFCGCGTAVHAAEKLKRQWIGIDVTHLAVSLIEKRMRDAFPGIAFEVHGTPKDLDGARNLAERDKYQFQWWACSLVNAQPYQGKKKGADSGIDGLIYFPEDDKHTGKIVVSVKGGENVTVKEVRDLRAVIEREKAAIGFFVTLNTPTKPMVTEAAGAGFYSPPMVEAKFPRLQILTIEGLLTGNEQPRYPHMGAGGLTFKKAKETDTSEQKNLFDG